MWKQILCAAHSGHCAPCCLPGGALCSARGTAHWKQAFFCSIPKLCYGAKGGGLSAALAAEKRLGHSLGRLLGGCPSFRTSHLLCASLITVPGWLVSLQKPECTSVSISHLSIPDFLPLHASSISGERTTFWFLSHLTTASARGCENSILQIIYIPL